MDAISPFRKLIGKRVLKELGNNISSAVIEHCGSKVSEESFLEFCSPKGCSLHFFFRQLNNASGVHEKYPIRHAFRMDLTESEIGYYVKELLEEAKERDDKIAAIPLDEVSVENVLHPSIQNEQEWSPNETTISFPKHVHPVKGVREKATEALKVLSKFEVERSMRVDLFERYKQLSKVVEEEKLELCPEYHRWLKYTLRDFKRNGLDNDAKTRERLTEIQTRMSQLSIQYNTNLGEENTKLIFKLEELDGMEDAFLASRKQEDGTYELSLKYPDIFPIFKNCKVAKTRELMEFKYCTKCKEENSKIMEELVKLRAEQASLLGYDTHADYILEIRMAKTKEIVGEFLWDLKRKLEPVLQSDIRACLSYKEEEEGKEADNCLTMADFRYYMAMREKNEFKVDHEMLKEYFPLQKVVKGALDIYQTILGLQFSEVEEGGFHKWHEEVQLFSVADKKTGTLVGHFYLDMHPREGKYGHAACFGLQAGGDISENGVFRGHQNPVAAMVCNFPKPTVANGGLITHSDVETFFHEFGHVMHQLCGGHNRCVRFAGTNVERDFVEAPSQMLENWVWVPESLRLMSGHYKTGEAIPDNVMSKLCASKNANCGLLNSRQLLFGIMDQQIHKSEEIDSEDVWQKLCGKIFGIEATPGTNMLASFGHLAGGYDAQYYGYLWSKVYSSDMFVAKFSGNKLLQPNSSGLEYRKNILEPGGTLDAMDMITNFLGRKPQSDAFMEELGLKSDSKI